MPAPPPSGTEVADECVPNIGPLGRERRMRFGVRGLWVTLRRRRRGTVHREAPEADEAVAD